MLRGAAGVGSWQVVSQGAGSASGKLVAMPNLDDIQVSCGKEACCVVADADAAIPIVSVFAAGAAHSLLIPSRFKRMHLHMHLHSTLLSDTLSNANPHTSALPFLFNSNCVQGQSFAEPQVIVVDKLTGNEDIPVSCFSRFSCRGLQPVPSCHADVPPLRLPPLAILLMYAGLLMSALPRCGHHCHRRCHQPLELQLLLAAGGHHRHPHRLIHRCAVTHRHQGARTEGPARLLLRRSRWVGRAGLGCSTAGLAWAWGWQEQQRRQQSSSGLGLAVPCSGICSNPAWVNYSTACHSALGWP
jgi:hypothetical protein